MTRHQPDVALFSETPWALTFTQFFQRTELIRPIVGQIVQKDDVKESIKSLTKNQKTTSTAFPSSLQVSELIEGYQIS